MEEESSLMYSGVFISKIKYRMGYLHLSQLPLRCFQACLWENLKCAGHFNGIINGCLLKSVPESLAIFFSLRIFFPSLICFFPLQSRFKGGSFTLG